MFKRLVSSVKRSSNATLRAWTYQFESIVAQRSRRFQQLFSFYHSVYGSHGLQRVLQAYRRQLQPPLRGIMISAVGAIGLSMSDISSDTGGGGGGGTTTPSLTLSLLSNSFDWAKERLSLSNFDLCQRDIEFLENLSRNKLCDKCQEKHMTYCYCNVGNQKCRAPGGKETVRSCRKPMHLQEPASGHKLIEADEEKPWEPYMSKNQFSIWRREEGNNSNYSYKVYARFDDITATDMLHVQTDLDYRRQWDSSAVTLEVIEVDPVPGIHSDVIYWELRWPKLFANRDYVYTRRYVVDDTRNIIMICSHGTKHPKRPRQKDKVRVEQYWSLMVIKPFRTFNEPGLHYMLTYYDDPGVPIPQSIKSWVTQKQMPDFLEKMYAATKKYCCAKAINMSELEKFTSFNIENKEYMANAERTSPLRKSWWRRDRG